MFEKILNHFGMSYIAMHDLDSPKVKRKEKWIKNPMWSINEKIFKEAQKGKNNKVIVNIPDFEGQFFGYLQSGDKPYNAICELQKPEKKEALKELDKIANDKLSDNYEREINSIDDYKIVGRKYCKVNNIDMKDKWDFGKEILERND